MSLHGAGEAGVHVPYSDFSERSLLGEHRKTNCQSTVQEKLSVGRVKNYSVFPHLFDGTKRYSGEADTGSVGGNCAAITSWLLLKSPRWFKRNDPLDLPL